MQFRGEVLGMALAITSPGLGIQDAQASVLNIGNVPGALQAGPARQGDPEDCATAVPDSVSIRLTRKKRNDYSFPKHGRSTLQTASADISFSLEPLLDYVTEPSKQPDTSMIKYCLGTRTVEAVVKMQAGKHKKARQVFKQIIRGNDSGKVEADVQKPVSKICRAKKPPKNIKFLMTETDRYKDRGVSLKFSTKKTLSLPCVSRDYTTTAN